MAKYPFKNCDVLYGDDNELCTSKAIEMGWKHTELNRRYKELDSKVELHTNTDVINNHDYD